MVWWSEDLVDEGGTRERAGLPSTTSVYVLLRPGDRGFRPSKKSTVGMGKGAIACTRHRNWQRSCHPQSHCAKLDQEAELVQWKYHNASVWRGM